ncbi:(R)-mandelonitrile lyase [Brachyspira pilosicoli]
MPDYKYQKSPEKTIFIKNGEGKKFKGAKEYFTGDVEVEILTEPNEDSHFSVAYVTFEAGARTAWHTHPCGQHLIVVEGIGLTQEEGGEVLEFHKGEALYWHGASPDCKMKHIAITGDKDGNNVTWLEHVTDEEYNAYKKNR